MELLKKAFVKDYKNTSSPEVRVRYGMVAGIIGLVINALLFAIKLTAGLFAGSITIVADAVNNLSDAGSSVITLIGFKLSGRPADKEHPFGHARYEYITAMIVSFVVLAIGFMLGESSVSKIISPEKVSADLLTFLVLIVAVAFKFFQMKMYRSFGRDINSPALDACAKDSRNDIISTLAVLLATAVMSQTGIMLDGYTGLLVSLFIIITSINLIRETMNPLLGAKPDKDLVNRIRQKILSYDGVLGIHDMMVHTYGEGRIFVMVHVEVPANVSILQSHEVIDRIERDFLKNDNIVLSVHMDPVETDNPILNTLKPHIINEIRKFDDRLSVHDFRVVPGREHTNVIFDVTVPFDEKTDVSVLETLSSAVAREFYPEMIFHFIISTEHSYV